MSKRERADDTLSSSVNQPNKLDKRVHNVYESQNEDVYDKLKETDVKSGDIIAYNSNNQYGYKEYKVVLDKDGEKTLEEIENPEDDNLYPLGGKKNQKKTKKTKKRKSVKKRKSKTAKKRKTRKSKK